MSTLACLSFHYIFYKFVIYKIETCKLVPLYCFIIIFKTKLKVLIKLIPMNISEQNV